MNNSPLNRLAAELRNQIYELVLTAPGPISCRFQGKDQAWVCDLKYKYGNLLAITQTCKEIHNECHEMVYALNTFEVQTSPAYFRYNMNQFRPFVGAPSAALVRSLVFDIGVLDTEDWDEDDPHYPHLIAHMETHVGFALDDLRDVASQHKECHFELKFKLHRLENLELKLDARDLALPWDEKLAQAIPSKEGDEWAANREKAIQRMKQCREENQEQYKVVGSWISYGH